MSRREGVIFASTLDQAQDVKIALGLQHWVATSPRAIRHGSLHGITSRPIVILTSTHGHKSISESYKEIQHELAPCFNTKPSIWQISHIPPGELK